MTQPIAEPSSTNHSSPLAPPAGPAPGNRANSNEAPASNSSRSRRGRGPAQGRCAHFTVRGRQCRLPALDPHTGLCFRHHALSVAGTTDLPSPSDSLDLSAELLPELYESQGRADLRKFLARLLALVTQGRVTPRRASVLAYITNQLLHPQHASTANTRPAPLDRNLLSLLLASGANDCKKPR